MRLNEELSRIDNQTFTSRNAVFTETLSSMYTAINHSKELDNKLVTMLQNNKSYHSIHRVLSEALNAQTSLVGDDDCDDLMEELEPTSQKLADNKKTSSTSTPENTDGRIATKIKGDVKRRFEQEKDPSDKSAELTDDGYGFEIVRSNGKKLTYNRDDGYKYESLNTVASSNNTLAEGFFDDEKELESKAYGEDEDTLFRCSRFFTDTYDCILEGSNADLIDNIKTIFADLGGKCFITNVRPDSFVINDAWLPSDAPDARNGKWTFYLTFVLQRLQYDARRLAEDITMWYYRTKLNGRKIPNTPALFHVIDLFHNGQINWVSEEEPIEESLTEDVKKDNMSFEEWVDWYFYPGFHEALSSLTDDEYYELEDAYNADMEKNASK